MKRSAFLLIAALVSLVYGLGLWIRPIHFMYMFEVGLDPSGILMARMFGIALISFAVVFLVGRKSPDSPALSAILWGGLTQNVLSALLLFRVHQMHWMIATAWYAIVIDVVLAIGFASFLFNKKSA